MRGETFEIGYKVVCLVDGKKMSYITDDNALEYSEHEPTFPKIENSKLFVFDTLKNAKKFLRRESYLNNNDEIIRYGFTIPQVWECRYIKSEKQLWPCWARSREYLARYWNDEEFNVVTSHYEGSTCADSVQLLRQVL